MIIKNILVFLLFISLTYSENCFSDEEVANIFNGIKELQYKDSVNVDLQLTLESQIKDYQQIVFYDSLMIFQLENQIKLKDDLIKEITPKWYENKYLWFGYGVSLIWLIK